MKQTIHRVSRAFGRPTWVLPSCLIAFTHCLPSTSRADASVESVFSADFSIPPTAADWIITGDSSLFAWSEAGKALSVTWDSSRTNSFFLHPLGTTLTAGDDFSLSFSLRMADVVPGIDPAKPYTFQMSVGLLNMAEAFRPDYFRGSGVNGVNGPRSLIEWDYFPDTGFGATISPVVFATNNAVRTSFTFPFELEVEVVYDVTLSYAASDRTLRTRILADGLPTQDIKAVVLPTSSGFDFRLDAVGVMSYSDAGQAKGFEGSILAHGLLSALTARFPGALRISLDSRTPGEVRFPARKNWSYELERSVDLADWRLAASLRAAADRDEVLVDPTASSAASFYRVKAFPP